MVLPDEVKSRFQSLFFDPPTQSQPMKPRKDVWRLAYGKTTNTERINKVDKFLNRYGIDYKHPTVRDAVAFDLIKLEDGSVSNDRDYQYSEHIGYSESEYERFLLNKNFRINLINLDTDWSSI